MKFHTVPIPGAVIVESSRFVDHRGDFARLYCDRELAKIIGPRRIVQVNHSRARAVGTVRGLHYQLAPAAEMKLVRCLRGRVWDVAVDLRAGSRTLLQWHGEELSAENCRMFVIPEGCAHGFQVLEEDSELLYLHTAFYTPAQERGIHPTDPRLAIRWPLPPVNLSERDRTQPPLADDYNGITV